MISAFSICFENNDLPFKYRTKDGRTKERNRDILLSNKFKPIIEKSLKVIKEGLIDKKISSYKLVDKNDLDANYNVWRMLNDFLTRGVVKEDHMYHSTVEADMNESANFSSFRTGNWVSEENKQNLYERYSGPVATLTEYITKVKYLESIRDNFNNDMKISNKNWKRSGKMDKFEFPDNYSRNKPMKFYQIGGIVIVQLIKSSISDEYTSYIMTNTHYSRVIDTIRSLGVAATYLPDIPGFENYDSTFKKIISKTINLGLSTPNGIGGVIKAARQILFLRGDKDTYAGSSPSVMYINGLEGEKLRYSETYADFIYSMIGDRVSSINFCNIFKIIPHPDADMDDVFDAVSGIKEPNDVKLDKLSRFEGIARKAVYESLTQQRFDIRAEAKDNEDDIAQDFVKMINSTSVPVSSIMKAGFSKWANIRFLPVRNIFDSEKQQIPVQNKSSATDSRLSRDKINTINRYKRYSEYLEIKERLTAVNDVVTRIEGTDELNFKYAKKRFERVVKNHEEFEREMLEKGISIDQITTEDLSEFVISDPENSYTVLTEPKLGEVHKKVTRLFYMAQQSLKIMTQVCERFTKKIISKTGGVSIVKSNRARRKEIESMLHAYKGSAKFSDEDDDGTVLYVSFDMTEFSKKFPQVLIRIMGTILSEISGEDWMSRIDVFFRASIVYHNTRGFIGCISGVKGGFEGFLNFLWTLAMRIVMDIATQATGVVGVLAVYSDDGLLRLYVEGDTKNVNDKISKLRDVFRSYGLIFHMDKTTASTEIFEYLGIYAQEGRILPSWFKEVMSFGKRKRMPGLETTYDRISLYISQADSVIKSNGPLYPTMLLKTFFAIDTIRRLNKRCKSRVLSLLTIVPYSAGGFRVSSITESSLYSGIESLSEFCADVELLQNYDPGAANTIFETVFDNLKTGIDSEKNILTGSLLSTNLRDTSGMGIVKDLLEEIDNPGVIINDPLSKPIVDKIIYDLKYATNIKPKLISNMIHQIPDVIQYTKSLAIVQSSAALKFITKDKIKQAQSKDTRICSDSISAWDHAIHTSKGEMYGIKSSQLIDRIIAKSYSSFKISPLIESPRVCLSPTVNDADIVGTIDITSNGSINEQKYIEPVEKFLGAQISAEHNSEVNPNTKQREYERFISISARLVASNPSILPIYYCIANAFRIPSPTLPTLSSVTGHRSARNFGSNAVSVKLPIPYHALINSYMTNNMWSNLRQYDRMDRTTMVVSAQIPTYLSYISEVTNTNIVQKCYKTYRYNLRDSIRNTTNPTTSIFTTPDRELISSSATTVFQQTIIEEDAQARSAETTELSQGIVEAINDSEIAKAILRTNLERWVYSSISNREYLSHAPMNIPDYWKYEIILDTCISVGFRISSPNIRRILQLAYNITVTDYKNISADSIMKSNEARGLLNTAINSHSQDIEKFDTEVSKVIGAINALDIDSRLLERLNYINPADNDYVKAVIRFMKRRSVTGGSNCPTVVINTDSFADTKLSRSVRTTIQEAIDSIYTQKLALFTPDCDIDDLDIDDVTLDTILIFKNMVRISGHRGRPYNQHMVSIQIIKFEMFIRNCIDNNLLNVSTANLEGFRLPYPLVSRIMKLNSVIGGRVTKTSGEDMRKCLREEGVPSFMIARANYILRKLRDRYNSDFINTDNILSNDRFMIDILNFIDTTYSMLIKEAVNNIVIRHKRELEIVGGVRTQTPVEDASYVSAVISTGPLALYECDTRRYFNDDDYVTMLTNLLYAHYFRWGIIGYATGNDSIINNIIISNSIVGNSTIEFRKYNDSPFTVKETEVDFTISLSSYDNEEAAINNYLHINRLEYGMAVMIRDDDNIKILSIIPSGTSIINTDCYARPTIINGSLDDIPIYGLKRVTANLNQLMREFRIRPQVANTGDDFAAVVLGQAYQRIVGAGDHVENEDHYLVAMAEMCRGSWSMDIGHRVSALFTAWLTISEGKLNKEFIQNLRAIREGIVDRDPKVRFKVMSMCDVIWEWIRMRNIVAGPDINGDLVISIITTISKRAYKGGHPVSVYNLNPKTVGEVKNIRGSVTLDDIIDSPESTLFHIPRVNTNREMLQAIEDDYEDFSGDEW